MASEIEVEVLRPVKIGVSKIYCSGCKFYFMIPDDLGIDSPVEPKSDLGNFFGKMGNEMEIDIETGKILNWIIPTKST